MKAIIREFLAGDLEQEYQQIVERMYFDIDAECMTGKQAFDFNQRLKSKPVAADQELSTTILE